MNRRRVDDEIEGERLSPRGLPPVESAGAVAALEPESWRPVDESLAVVREPRGGSGFPSLDGAGGPHVIHSTDALW
jgi:hypothetical protein